MDGPAAVNECRPETVRVPVKAYFPADGDRRAERPIPAFLGVTMEDK